MPYDTASTSNEYIFGLSCNAALLGKVDVIRVEHSPSFCNTVAAFTRSRDAKSKHRGAFRNSMDVTC